MAPGFPPIGGVMPAAVLEECELPQVVSMMQEAVKW